MLLLEPKWDTDGQSWEECGLPVYVLCVNVPPDYIDEELLSDALSDTFGYCHYGFNKTIVGNRHVLPSNAALMFIQGCNS